VKPIIGFDKTPREEVIIMIEPDFEVEEQEMTLEEIKAI